MVEINRLDAFLGNPYMLNGIKIYSPTIKEVSNIGQETYYCHLVLSSFDKEKILIDLLKFDIHKYEQICNGNDYEVLTSHPGIRDYITESLSFFTKEDVKFEPATNSFQIGEMGFIDINNYVDVANVIRELNGNLSQEQNNLKPSTNKAKQMLEKMMAFSKKQESKEDYLDLKDIISILSSAPDNGITIFNVGELTIYQVYEQFERVNLKESFIRLLPVWANGHLDKDSKLPEWITKTKF
ncbi:hypothetical protein SAMN04487895_10367 [Paenibacillus sophorae]|uniref:Uncharacterized protein n=1 Tax=Paenibacillus sophorae TaxID=1333845 RepID=A0A1H8JM81_9BACL|nr:hypothetical protein [Paenibacillus sophorae]QWU13401.1 hypothetical protein KP014_15480 [Paenibacillus sophorae]SEN81456.1 hypothetical protein SAMN04487895_10367 [Paenibacillus sophorae]